MFRTRDGQVIKAGRSWTDAHGITHPSNWHIWSAEYKEALGITEIVQESHPDSRFYIWSQNADYSYNQTDKSLDDVLRVNSDGNAVTDDDGNQIVDNGLKSVWVKNSKTTANNLLSSTDWQEIAKAARGRAVDADVAIYRSAVLAACDAIEEKIAACADLAEFKALFDTPTDSDGNATGNSPIYDWPKSV